MTTKSKEEFEQSLLELRQWAIKEAFKDVSNFHGSRKEWTDEQNARYAEMARLFDRVTRTAGTYVYDQFEAGHDIGYETAQSDYVAGFWDD